MARKKNVTSSMDAQERAATPFATRLRELATDGRALAAHLGLSPQAVSQYKNGDTYPGLETLIRIADYYNVSVDYLLGRTDIRSALPDVQTACAVTGLSETAVNRLIETKHPDRWDIFQPAPHPMTTLLESDSFPELRQQLSILLFHSKAGQCSEDTYDMQELRLQRAFNRFLAEIRGSVHFARPLSDSELFEEIERRKTWGKYGMTYDCSPLFDKEE